MFDTHALTFSYSPQKTFSFPDLRCEAGDALLISGQSGSGKTTLLHLLALLLTPQSGQIHLDGASWHGLSPRAAARVRAAHLGIVYQRAHFVKALSVLDNLLLTNYLADRRPDRAKAHTLAESLGFSPLLDRKTYQLSQGEQQRVSIARALMNSPAVILADEPTASLDDGNASGVAELLRQQAHVAGASLLVVTHDQRLRNAFSQHIDLDLC